MKLNRESFTKTIDKDIVRYSYNCNDTNFYLELVGQNNGRNINVFSGSLEDRQNLLITTSSLEAWNYFEGLLKVCSGEQGSSGGGNLGNNPQQNPNILPLLAINGTKGGMTKITLFALMDDKSQNKIFDFEVDSKTMPQTIPTSVFTVDWSGEDITQLLKCEVLLKEYDSVTFEEEPNSKVFVFIPKSIVNQGGEEGGNTQKGEKGEEGEASENNGENGEKQGKTQDQESKSDKDSESKSESGGKGEPTGEEGEPTDKEGESSEKGNTDEGGKPTKDQSDKQSDKSSGDESMPNKKGDDEENETKGSGREIDMDFSQIIQELSKSTDGEYNPSELLSIFRNVESGEVWLSTNNFPKIKKDLNLPKTTTPRQLSQIIINSK